MLGKTINIEVGKMRPIKLFTLDIITFPIVMLVSFFGFDDLSIEEKILAGINVYGIFIVRNIFLRYYVNPYKVEISKDELIVYTMNLFLPCRYHYRFDKLHVIFVVNDFHREKSYMVIRKWHKDPYMVFSKENNWTYEKQNEIFDILSKSPNVHYKRNLW